MKIKPLISILDDLPRYYLQIKSRKDREKKTTPKIRHYSLGRLLHFGGGKV